MKALGFEPRTYGLKVRGTATPSLDDETTSVDASKNLAHSLACISENPSLDPDLARIFDAWQDLPDPIRLAILALVDAGRKQDASRTNATPPKRKRKKGTSNNQLAADHQYGGSHDEG